MAESGSSNTLQRQLSRLLWRASLKPKATADERRESWAANRRECMTQAGKLLRMMEDEGIAITLAGLPKQDDEAADTDD